MEIKRDKYLRQLIDRKENSMIKVVTGVRRSGKSYLLFNLFYDWLLSQGVEKKNIITIALDEEENAKYRDCSELLNYIYSRIDGDKMHYVFIDEIQYAITKEELKQTDVPVRIYGVLNSLLHKRNVDVYVTGSNSKLLSKDVLTEFRGRGDEVRISPLTFAEFYSAVGGDVSTAYEQYALFGGMPLVAQRQTPEQKFAYLDSLFGEIYFKDIAERYSIDFPDVLRELTDVLCSSVGSLTNATKLANTLKSVKNIKVSQATIAKYLEYLEESFVFRQAKRFDVKGKRYFDYPSKYYCVDPGLRNARLNYREQYEGYLMENIVYNELVARGYNVDVGVVESTGQDEQGKRHKANYEIDFVANMFGKRCYVQCATDLSDPQKQSAELRPLILTKDFFTKVIITKSNALPWQDENGILHLGLYDFLLNEDSLKV